MPKQSSKSVALKDNYFLEDICKGIQETKIKEDEDNNTEKHDRISTYHADFIQRMIDKDNII